MGCYECKSVDFLFSVVDTEWSYKIYHETYNLPWTCPQCEITLCLSPIERLQHKQFTCSAKTEQKDKVERKPVRENKPNAKDYKCGNCGHTLYMTPVEILKHRKGCT